LQQGLKLKLCIITGKNQELYQELQKNQDETLLIFPFYKPLYELYAIANAFVTKPGGLTVAESLLWQLPLFITHWLPGQEEPNVAYLKSHGLIQAFPGEENEAALVTAVLAELKSGQLRTALGNNQSREKLIDPTEPGRRAVASLEAMFHTQRSV
jgi:UDP-N-acetylglucosamine:LPS N-acetylglucosamine transferase